MSESKVSTKQEQLATALSGPPGYYGETRVDRDQLYKSLLTGTFDYPFAIGHKGVVQTAAIESDAIGLNGSGNDLIVCFQNYRKHGCTKFLVDPAAGAALAVHGFSAESQAIANYTYFPDQDFTLLPGIKIEDAADQVANNSTLIEVRPSVIDGGNTPISLTGFAALATEFDPSRANPSAILTLAHGHHQFSLEGARLINIGDQVIRNQQSQFVLDADSKFSLEWNDIVPGGTNIHAMDMLTMDDPRNRRIGLTNQHLKVTITSATPLAGTAHGGALTATLYFGGISGGTFNLSTVQVSLNYYANVTASESIQLEQDVVIPDNSIFLGSSLGNSGTDAMDANLRVDFYEYTDNTQFGIFLMRGYQSTYNIRVRQNVTYIPLASVSGLLKGRQMRYPQSMVEDVLTALSSEPGALVGPPALVQSAHAAILDAPAEMAPAIVAQAQAASFSGIVPSRGQFQASWFDDALDGIGKIGDLGLGLAGKGLDVANKGTKTLAQVAPLLAMAGPYQGLVPPEEILARFEAGSYDSFAEIMGPDTFDLALPDPATVSDPSWCPFEAGSFASAFAAGISTPSPDVGTEEPSGDGTSEPMAVDDDEELDPSVLVSLRFDANGKFLGVFPHTGPGQCACCSREEDVVMAERVFDHSTGPANVEAGKAGTHQFHASSFFGGGKGTSKTAHFDPKTLLKSYEDVHGSFSASPFQPDEIRCGGENHRQTLARCSKAQARPGDLDYRRRVGSDSFTALAGRKGVMELIQEAQDAGSDEEEDDDGEEEDDDDGGEAASDDDAEDPEEESEEDDFVTPLALTVPSKKKKSVQGKKKKKFTKPTRLYEYSSLSDVDGRNYLDEFTVPSGAFVDPMLTGLFPIQGDYQDKLGGAGASFNSGMVGFVFPTQVTDKDGKKKYHFFEAAVTTTMFAEVEYKDVDVPNDSKIRIDVGFSINAEVESSLKQMWLTLSSWYDLAPKLTVYVTLSKMAAANTVTGTSWTFALACALTGIPCGLPTTGEVGLGGKCEPIGLILTKYRAALGKKLPLICPTESVRNAVKDAQKAKGSTRKIVEFLNEILDLPDPVQRLRQGNIIMVDSLTELFGLFKIPGFQKTIQVALAVHADTLALSSSLSKMWSMAGRLKTDYYMSVDGKPTKIDWSKISGDDGWTQVAQAITDESFSSLGDFMNSDSDLVDKESKDTSAFTQALERLKEMAEAARAPILANEAAYVGGKNAQEYQGKLIPQEKYATILEMAGLKGASGNSNSKLVKLVKEGYLKGKVYKVTNPSTNVPTTRAVVDSQPYKPLAQSKAPVLSKVKSLKKKAPKKKKGLEIELA